MKAIKFAEWLAENHYYLYNIDTKTGLRFWRNENKQNKTTEQLYKEFYNKIKK